MRVMPIRYTDDIAASAGFLRALGLDDGSRSRGGGWAEMLAGGGAVGPHVAAEAEEPRRAGDTELSFVTDEPLEEVRHRLLRAGFGDAHIIDESFGRSLRVTDPDGVLVQVDEHDTALYT